MSIKTRIGKLWTEAGRRKHKGPKLTYDGATYLHVVDDAEAIEAARAAGRPVFMPDDDRQITMTLPSAWAERPVVVYE